jgi:hypothetical protein
MIVDSGDFRGKIPIRLDSQRDIVIAALGTGIDLSLSEPRAGSRCAIFDSNFGCAVIFVKGSRPRMRI